MTWVKLDDQFPQHPKVASVGPLGVALQVAGMCYCARQLTDGFVPRSVALTLMDVSTVWDERFVPGSRGDVAWTMREIIEDLLSAGLWSEVDGGYEIHDYLSYQPSRNAVMSERNAAKDRMQALRLSRSGEHESKFDGSSPSPVPVPLKEGTPKGVPPAEKNLPQSVREVYDHWRTARGKTHGRYSTMTPARSKRIRSRLLEFSADDLKRAIDGVALDPWDGRGEHDDLTVIFRSTEQVQKFLAFADEPPADSMGPADHWRREKARLEAEGVIQ